MQVTCDRDDCFQHVTKEFFESHLGLRGFSADIDVTSGNYEDEVDTSCFDEDI